MSGKSSAEFPGGLGVATVVITTLLPVCFIDDAVRAGATGYGRFFVADTFFAKSDDGVIFRPVLFPFSYDTLWFIESVDITDDLLQSTDCTIDNPISLCIHYVEKV